MYRNHSNTPNQVKIMTFIKVISEVLKTTPESIVAISEFTNAFQVNVSGRKPTFVSKQKVVDAARKPDLLSGLKRDFKGSTIVVKDDESYKEFPNGLLGYEAAIAYYDSDSFPKQAKGYSDNQVSLGYFKNGFVSLESRIV